ncbi:hypothetical protein D3C86_1367420 [compost metagenome]
MINTAASSAAGTSHLSKALAFIVSTSRNGREQHGLLEAGTAGDEVGNRGVFSTADRPEKSMLEGRSEQFGLKPTRIELHRR